MRRIFPRRAVLFFAKLANFSVDACSSGSGAAVTAEWRALKASAGRLHPALA